MEAVLRPSLRLCRSAAQRHTASSLSSRWTTCLPRELSPVPLWNVRLLSAGPSPEGVLAEVLVFPALSPTMTTGTVASWKGGPGDSFAPGDSLCEIETDKATVDYEVQDDFVLAKILVPDGSTDVEVGTPVALYVEDEDAYRLFVEKGYRLEEGVSLDGGSASSAPEATPPPPPSGNVDPAPTARTPSIKFLGKRSSAPPVVSAASTVPAQTTLSSSPPPPPPTPTTTMKAPAPPTTSLSVDDVGAVDDEGRGYVDLPNSNMRKVIASRLTSSKGDTPHYYTRTVCVIDNLLQLRKDLAALGVKVSVNDLIVKCNALALRDVKICNSSFDEGTQTVKENNTVDISIAVATPNGLITPIIKNADVKGLGAISADAKDLALRARENKLKLDEFQGGTFTISNMGMFGIREFTSIINTPQSCIMAVGTGKKVFVATTGGLDDLTTETQMVVSLSCDRRVVDEDVAAEYLSTFKKYMANPTLLMA